MDEACLFSKIVKAMRMKWDKLYPLVFLFFVGMVACTPKTTEEVTQPAVEEETPPKPEEETADLSPCPKFSDAPDPDGISDKYVIYRDFFKVRQWDQAFELWKEVYAVAPAADGRRNTVYADGIRFYQHYLNETQDKETREQYIDNIFRLYDEIDQCYSEGGYIIARKAFDLYYKYQDRATKEEVFAMFKEAMDTDGLKTADFVINPFTALLIEMYDQGKVSDEEAKKYEQQIRAILAEGLKDCEGVACDRWKIIEEYAPNRLQYFETVEGFYDCEYYMDRYYPEFLAAQEDCDVIRTVYSRLKWGMCTEMDERFKELIRVGNENCVVETAGPAKIAYNCLKEADYQCAIDGFIEAANNTDDTEKKGQYLLIVAKIYQAHLRNFSKSRQFALDAAEVRPNWGEPYLHIGRLYASSGPLCGPGRGWDSQIVVWPAIDMWNKAKQVDPEAAAEANKWIGQYAQYMPKKEDVFIRNLKAGDSFFVPCWIQRSTRIRTAD
jgi:hypothetical protein